MPYKPVYFALFRDEIEKTAQLLCVQSPEIRTNARLKKYLDNSVLQVASEDVFSTGQWERIDGKSMRPWDVSKKGEAKDADRSLYESKRRAKRAVFDLVMCNKFDYFFTWTLDKSKIDRYSPEEVYKKVRAFLSNMTQRKDFQYVVIPEHHSLKKDEKIPAIHFHGFCNLGGVKITPALNSNGKQKCDKNNRLIFNMSDFPFGFSTCVQLDEDYIKAASYVVKYITKADEKIFGKWYLSSRNLRKKPDIIPLERMNFDKFCSQNPDLSPCSVYRDIMMVSKTL